MAGTEIPTIFTRTFSSSRLGIRDFLIVGEDRQREVFFPEEVLEIFRKLNPLVEKLVGSIGADKFTVYSGSIEGNSSIFRLPETVSPLSTLSNEPMGLGFVNDLIRQRRGFDPDIPEEMVQIMDRRIGVNFNNDLPPYFYLVLNELGK